MLLTGYGTRELEQEALKEGAYGVIQKPVHGKVFLSVVRSAIFRRSTLRARTNLFSVERERLSSRLKQVNERLRKQIEDSENGKSKSEL
jgi:FixJ family two-component response regulator